MSDEEVEVSETSEDLDDLEDIEKLVVGEKPPTEVKDVTEVSEEVSKEPDKSEFTATDEDLEDEEQVRQELLLKEKEQQLSAKEEELKKEEERRDKMKVLLSGYLELKAKKEIEKAMLNEKKIIAQWLYPFRAAYQKEWGLEMTKLKLAFQRALDYKKAHIHAIERERKLCELNHLWADCAHYQISEELFDFLRKRCEELKQKYLDELEETKKYYLEREEEILDKCVKAEERAKFLVQLRNDIHENILKQTKEALEKYKYQGEFLKEKEKELIDSQHMTYVEKIAQELQTAISPPEHKMDQIREIFNEWKDKYETFTQIFAKNKKEMHIVANEIPALEERVAAARKRLEDIKKETKRKQVIQMEEVVHLQSVSKKYEKIRPSMRKMISESEEVMEQLRERKKKLEKIMKLKKFCDQLEAECDRINDDIPFLDPTEKEQIKENDCLSFIRELCSEDIEDPSLLENMYRKINRVKLQNQILRHDIEKLKTKRKALKSDMFKYLQNISSGEWQRIPEELHFDSISPDIPTQIQAQQTKKIDADEQHKKNLELLRRKCWPINSKILNMNVL